MKEITRQSWIYSKWYDLLFILSPPFICLLIIGLFPGYFQVSAGETALIWFVLVLCIDVGHVYSTIYRTYFDKNIINKHKTFFYLSPILIYILFVLLYSIDSMLFWRGLAYLAVFHFVRQQYGFMRLYSRNETNKASLLLDKVVIYSSTLYPLLYWHFSGKQQFNWFVEGDFLYLNIPWLIPAITTIYILVLVVYLIHEIFLFIRDKSINVPKNILIIGTALSWYFGIVYFKGDLTFTLLNVVTHGIPYYALVWAYGNKRSKTEHQESFAGLKRLFQPRNIVPFVGILLVLAYIEEMIWDGFVWKEHLAVFPTSNFLPDITGSEILMSLLVPLFTLPQLLHYFIDGFIWKIKKDDFNWFIFFNADKKRQ